ncbi:uncharacterized protein NEMAJ01_1234 [Nematocida major]|uniref:uncharacterized protein n=1 Tax=Nematocida major TaxID=1912982 RepID=UPI0020079BC0|nr:uncharacterized protein NEMAJ01_1234 [Nematocida major]KAH9386338.1 hypothetical protein NEMAJ01_1234 [Nematocida major]
MSLVSEYLFAIDQWKLLEQWKMHILGALPLSSSQESSLVASIEARSRYDAHINAYSSQTYQLLISASGHLGCEIVEYSRLEQKMLRLLNKLRGKMLPTVSHDVAYLRHFLMCRVDSARVFAPTMSRYYMHIIELILVGELFPVHFDTCEKKLHVHLKKAPFVGINMRRALAQITEVVLVLYEGRRVTEKQEHMLRSAFSVKVTRVLK